MSSLSRARGPVASTLAAWLLLSGCQGSSEHPQRPRDPAGAVRGALVSPKHVIAAQGPTADGAAYVLVTWRRVASATSYEVLRDGRDIGRVDVSGEPWDDTAFRDPAPPAGRHRYSVRALAGRATSAATPAYRLTVRTTGSIGSGKIFSVDQQPQAGDAAKAQAAIDAARRAGGGVVEFAARTYTLEAPLLVSAGNDIVLRGQGADRTILRPGYAGAAEPCGRATNLVVLRGRAEGAPLPAGAIREGQRVISTSARLARGATVLFDASGPQRNPKTYEEQGIVQDPGRGHDARHVWDGNDVVSARKGRVTFRYPFSYGFRAGTVVSAITRGHRLGVESMTLEGRSAAEDTYYQLLSLEQVAGARVADVRFRWANRNFIQVRSSQRVDLVGIEGDFGGERSYDLGTCKYKVTVVEAADVRILGATLGREADDANQSFITFQRAPRAVVRASRFFGSRTYAINEHGGGSRGLLLENNRIAVGPGAKYAGILLGNNTWGFSGPAIIRGNTFVGNSRDVAMQENTYGVRIVENTSQGAAQASIVAYGWAAPGTAASRHGSLRLTIRSNTIAGAAGDGIVLGGAESPWYPYEGVRDVLISGNVVDAAGTAIHLKGDAARTERFFVFDNQVTGAVVHPRPGREDVWTDSGGDVHHGQARRPSWSRAEFAWEPVDGGG